MANIGHGEKYEETKSRLMHSATRLFLQKGYSATSVKEIAEDAGTNTGVLMRAFGSKENILAELVSYVLEGQFSLTGQLLEGITEDNILFYAAETTLQLHIVETNENVRDLYAMAYSMDATTQIIQRTITKKLEELFKDYLPNLETKDFYELEIASGGIMRGFMTIPCDMYFTMERKVKRFLETTFLVYRFSDEKIAQTIEFVSRFDFKELAERFIGDIMRKLEVPEAMDGVEDEVTENV